MNQPETLTNHWLNSSPCFWNTKIKDTKRTDLCLFCPLFVDLEGCMAFCSHEFLELDQEVMSLEAEAPPPKKSFGSPSEASGRCHWSWWEKCSGVTWETDLDQHKNGTKYDPGFCFLQFDQMKWNVQTSTSIIFSNFDEWWIVLVPSSLPKWVEYVSIGVKAHANLVSRNTLKTHLASLAKTASTSGLGGCCWSHFPLKGKSKPEAMVANISWLSEDLFPPRGASEIVWSFPF